MAKRVVAMEQSKIRLDRVPEDSERALTVIPRTESINTRVPPGELGQPDTLVLVGNGPGHRWIAIYLSEKWRSVLFWSITSLIVGALVLKGPALFTALRIAFPDIPLAP